MHHRVSIVVDGTEVFTHEGGCSAEVMLSRDGVAAVMVRGGRIVRRLAYLGADGRVRQTRPLGHGRPGVPEARLYRAAARGRMTTARMAEGLGITPDEARTLLQRSRRVELPEAA